MTGGGTGGHVFPLVAVARALKKISARGGVNLRMFFIGPEEFSLDVLRDEGIAIKKIIQAGKLRRYLSWRHLIEFIKIPVAFVEAFFKIWRLKPNVVLGKGGYGSVIPVIAAWLLGRAVLVHESDVKPGLANRLLAKLCSGSVALSFRETTVYFPKNKIFLVGNPVRFKFGGLGRSSAAEILKFKPTRPVIFVSGGSQGAAGINNLIGRSINQLTRHYALIWSTGLENFRPVIEKLKVKIDGNIKLIPFLSEPELAAAYTLAELVVIRAGAGSIFEAAAFGRPSMLVPLAGAAADHQRANARAYADTGAAVVLNENALTDKVFTKSIDDLMSDPARRGTMAQRARQFAKIEAAEDIAEILLDLAEKSNIKN